MENIENNVDVKLKQEMADRKAERIQEKIEERRQRAKISRAKYYRTKVKNKNGG